MMRASKLRKPNRRRAIRARLALVTALAMLPLGCGDSGGEPIDALLQPICTDGTRWSQGGAPIFAERTTEWGLTGVLGVRLSAVDFDGDGWTDLIVRRGGDAPDDFSEPPACCESASCPEGTSCPVRRTWLMKNMGGTHFADVTQQSGLVTPRVGTDPNFGRPGGVYAFGDIDNDGDLDAYTGLSDNPDQPQIETSELMINQGDGTFVLGPPESLLRMQPGDVPAGAAFIDYDRNGVLDIWITQNSFDGTPQGDRLYWGEGNGLYQEATVALGLNTKPWSLVADLNAALSHTVSWGALGCDLNADGYPELLSSSYGRSPNHLWQAGGPDAGFAYSNRSIDSGYAFDHRVDWSDNESARCWCTLHPEAADCAGVPAPMYIGCTTDEDAFRWNHPFDREPFRLGGNSGATICGDVDNDGDMDLLTTEIVHWDVGSSSDPSELMLNTGEPEVRFERPGNEVTGLTRSYDMIDWNDGDISAAMFDFDNDGWLDVYIGSTDYPGAKGLLYHQHAPARFTAVPFAEGIDHNRSHGIAVADFDRDGDLDVVVGHSRARCGNGATDCYPTPQLRLFENQLAQQGNWVQVKLLGGLGSNRSAIGARVEVTTEDGVTQTQEVGGGHGHYGAQHDLTLHFGLGTSCRAQVVVRWPDAAFSEQSFELLSGYRFVVEQGQEPSVDPSAPAQ